MHFMHYTYFNFFNKTIRNRLQNYKKISTYFVFLEIICNFAPQIYNF